MNHLTRAIATLIAMSLIPVNAFADAGTVSLNTKAAGTGTCGSIYRNQTCYLLVPTSGSGNSQVFTVSTNWADACATSDTASATDRGMEVRFWKVIFDGTEAGSLLPTVDAAYSLTDADGDCAALSVGKWWIEVETAPTLGSGGIVTITGRDS